MKITSAEFIKGIRGTDGVTQDGVAQFAFVGRSNVGKSSLIVSLTNNKQLVKVSNTPGKTREINFFRINHSWMLVDLPGYGYAKVSPQEKEKLQKLIIWYLTDRSIKPTRVFLVIDCKVGITPFDEQMLEILRDERHPFSIVVNKTDKLGQKDLASQLKHIREAAGDAELILTAATKVHGAKDVLARIAQALE